MANFSQEELEKIKVQRKPQDELPTYFSSENQQETPISRDFEAYLILQPQSLKQTTLSWIREVVDIQEENIDRDEILSRYLNTREEEADKVVEQLDEALGDFDQFKAGLLQVTDDPTRFAEIPEISLLAQSLQRPIQEMVFIRESAFHESNLSKLLRLRFTISETTENTERELQSWQTVISAYQGQKDNAALPSTSIPNRGPF